jgi:hypothetical protein
MRAVYWLCGAACGRHVSYAAAVVRGPRTFAVARIEWLVEPLSAGGHALEEPRLDAHQQREELLEVVLRQSHEPQGVCMDACLIDRLIDWFVC